MPQSQPIDLFALSDLATPWCLRVVATMRIADHLAAGVTNINDLAQTAGADADALHRVLRHLSEQGIFLEVGPGQFALNDAAQPLRDDHPARLRIGLDLGGIGNRMAYAWGTLPDAVRTGKPGYAGLFGLPFWDDLAAHPAIAASFDALMGPAGHGIPDPNVLLSSDWQSIHTVVDVGGGTGALLAEVLRAQPTVQGILVDLPRTVAQAAEVFRAAGVAARVTTVGQSFFDPLPAGADLYLLKNVLADWPDPEAEALLRNCANAARPGGRVVILGGVSPDTETAAPAPELLMLVLVGGKQRTLMEFGALARRAGLRIVAAERQPSGRFVVECRPTTPHP